jgi:tRNA pseudouridine55 synthase
MFGFYAIEKPVGPTSHAMVAHLRRRLPRRTKVGHAGTLDPFASGVLVVAVGPATRLIEFVQGAPKRYQATFILGATSTTDDSQGEITPLPTPEPPSRQALRTALDAFGGTIQQVPPNHSAVHVNGERAYTLARQGQALELRPREVHIYELILSAYDWPSVQVEIHCGSGTYIRSIARDLGAALGCGGYCSALRRTAVGEFTEIIAKRVEQIDLHADLVAPTACIPLPRITLSPTDCMRIHHGRTVPLPEGFDREVGNIFLENQAGELLALAGHDDEVLIPRKVFSTQPA